MQKKRAVIIDADTGIDDSIAIAAAAYMDNIDIKLIIASTGNTTAEQAAINTLNILHYIEKEDIPVVLGASSPISKKTLKISAHGADGLGGYKFKSRSTKPVRGTVEDVIHNTLKTTGGKVTYICLGPATNLAKFLHKYPEDSKKLSKIYFSGGLLEESKEGEKPYLGFNVGFDPLAASYILKAGIPVVICPSDMGHVAHFTKSDIKQIKKTNVTGKMFGYIFKSYKDRHIKIGAANHDLCAFMSFSHPSIFKYRKAKVSIKYYEGLASGVLNFDFESADKPENVVIDVAITELKNVFFDCLKKMP